MTLSAQQRLFASLVPGLLTQAHTLGYEVTLGECYRTPEQAAWNAEHGTGIANSLHTQRLAIDLMLWKDGAYLAASTDYEPLGAWWEQQHPLCCWGGRFSRPDGDHFSMEWQGVR